MFLEEGLSSLNSRIFFIQRGIHGHAEEATFLKYKKLKSV